MKKAEVIERHARNLKQEVGTGLSTSECYQIIKSAVNEVLNLPCVIVPVCELHPDASGCEHRINRRCTFTGKCYFKHSEP